MSKLMDELVPKGPPDLCFESSAFTKESFSVDQFLQDHRSGGNLETMRDDLGLYLKVLRSAMIDLINKDYADYVNLSSNLMGLDKAIGKINAPLGQLKEELLQVNQYMSDAVSEVTRKLELKKELRERKRSLRCLSRVRMLLGKSEQVLKCDAALDDDSVERAVFEFSQLQFNSERCLHLMSHRQKQMYEEIGQVLVSNVSRVFVESLEGGEAGVERLSHTLVYCLNINRHLHIERLCRERLVSPCMERLITKESLRSMNGGLAALYNSVLQFIDEDMKHLLQVTSSPDSRGLTVYEFLLRSVWPEVESRLQVNLPSIYDAGDPDAFYLRYKETMRFLEEFSKRFRREQSRAQWYQLDSFNCLLDKWNVAVYFQIRFQEIVRGMESGLSRGREASVESGLSRGREASVESDGVRWNLVATESLWSALTRCWAPGVVLLPIADKMWKLTLQILSRYLTWITHFLSLGKGGDEGERTQVLVCLRCDVHTLTQKLPLVEKTALDSVPRLSPATATSLSRSLEECGERLTEELRAIDEAIVVSLSAQCAVQVRQVSDIPRLYRRTNREAPTKPCLYVSAMVQPALDLVRSAPTLSSSLWLHSVFSDLTTQYYKLVSEVLTSVQKTEESLRRLKKARDNRTQSLVPPPRSADDDKIRQQLCIDVNHYALQMDSLGIKRNSVEMLTELLLLVESTVKL